MGVNFSEHADEHTLTDRLRLTATKYPDREMLTFYRGTTERVACTASQLYTLGGRFASRLRDLGLKKQDVVVNLLPNSPERIVTDIGVLLAGCVLVNGQMTLADGEDFFLSMWKAKTSLVILGANEAFPPWRTLKPFVGSRITDMAYTFDCERVPDLKMAFVVTRKESADHPAPPMFEDLTLAVDQAVVHEEVQPDDVAIVCLTSGSTGFSKMIGRSHAELIFCCENSLTSFGKVFPFQQYEDRPFFNDRPFGWILGLPLETFCSLKRRVLSDQWSPVSPDQAGRQIWTMIKEERCFAGLVLSLGASTLQAYVRGIDQAEVEEHRLKLILTGGQPFTKRQMNQYFELCEYLGIAYGSSESYINATITFTKAESEQVDNFCCGPAVDYVEQVKVVDREGRDCPPGEMGFVLVKGGAGIFSGYFNRQEPEDPASTGAFTGQGYFKTNDSGCLDAQGDLYVHGRQNDAIMYGPLLVYPGWLEDRILQHPALAQACVVPVSDPVKFHEICACVKVMEKSVVTEDELKVFCEKIFMSNDKTAPYPKFFLILGEDFPETATGKPDRRKLKRQAEALFGVEADGSK